MIMRRRDLLAGAGAIAITSCSQEENLNTKVLSKERFNWKMVTTWPPNFPGMGTGVARLVEHIDKASAGRLKITTYAAGELVPAFEVFDTVSRGTAEMGHGAAYYWKGKSEAAQFFTAIPFGMNVLEMNIHYYIMASLNLIHILIQE